MKYSQRIMATAALCVAMATASLAHAELRVVDGNLWAASSQGEKAAYLIGVANTVAVNRAVQAKKGKMDPQSANDRYGAALDAGTIEQAVQRIDAWYASNPSRMDVPVLGVVWMAMVKAR